jgi:hypothetical protein
VQIVYHVIIRHTVKDYRKWRPVFDTHEEQRRRAGLSKPRVMRNLDDPEDIIVELEATQPRLALEFLHSESLRQAMAQAGVISQPEFYVLEEV